MMSRESAVALLRLRRISALPVIVVLVISLGLAGCSVQFVGRYDEQTVQSVTDLLRKIEGRLIKLERVLESPDAAEQGKYSNYVDFYDEIKTDLSLIRARAQAIPKNELTVKQIDLLADEINKFEDAHQRGILNPAVVRIARKNISQTIEAIMAAEFAKKRG